LNLDETRAVAQCPFAKASRGINSLTNSVLPRRFHASTKLNASRLASSAGQVGDEIVQHLNALGGADVEVTIEVHASVPNGIPENVVRTVSENAKTLKFDSWGFEEE